MSEFFKRVQEALVAPTEEYELAGERVLLVGTSVDARFAVGHIWTEMDDKDKARTNPSREMALHYLASGVVDPKTRAPKFSRDEAEWLLGHGAAGVVDDILERVRALSGVGDDDEDAAAA